MASSSSHKRPADSPSAPALLTPHRDKRGRDACDISVPSVLLQYNTTLVLVTVSSIVLSPEDAVRPTDEAKALENYYQSFMNNGYGANPSYISVAVLDDVPVRDIVAKAHGVGGEIPNITPSFRVKLIDGAHRLSVLRLPEVCKNYTGGLVKALLYTRKDSRRIHPNEMIVIGNALNAFTELAIPMSTHDKIRMVLSFVRSTVAHGTSPDAAQHEQNLARNVRVSEIVKAVKEAKLFPALADNAIRRYASIAAGLFHNANRVPLLPVLLEKYKPKLSIVSLSMLWESRPLAEFKFLAEALFKWSRVSTHASTTPSCKAFIKWTVSLYNTINKVIVESGFDDRNVYDFEAKQDSSGVSDSEEPIPVVMLLLEKILTISVRDVIHEKGNEMISRFIKIFQENAVWPTPPGGQKQAQPVPVSRSDGADQTASTAMHVDGTPAPPSSPGPQPDRHLPSSAPHDSLHEHAIPMSAGFETPIIPALPWEEGGVVAPRTSQALDGLPGTPSVRRSGRIASRPANPSLEKDVSSSGSSISLSKREETRTLSKSPAPFYPSHTVNEAPDSAGFQVLRRHDQGFGFVYKAPRPRMDGFTTLQRSGDWWKGVLKGTSEVRGLFRDVMATEVFCPSFWRLQPTTESDWSWKLNFPDIDTCGKSTRDPVFNMQGVLRSMGMRPPHKALFYLTENDLKHNRAGVLHSAFASACSEIREMGIKTAPRDQIRTSLKSLSQYFFRAKRHQIDSDGYVILPNLMRDTFAFMDSLSLEHPSFDTAADRLWEFVGDRIPTASQIHNNDLSDEQCSMFYGICNRADPRADGLQGDLQDVRLSTTGPATNDLLEQSGNFDVLKARCRVDIRLTQIASFLHLDYGEFDDFSLADHELPPPLYVPDTGGRFLATLPHCQSQIPHCDFAVSEDISYPAFDKFPSYFMIATGAEGSSLWVLPHSHKEAYNTEDAEREYAHRSRLTLVSIPPHSVFIGRGDLVHAGSGAREAGGELCLRYHMYLQRKGMALPDAIITKPLFSLHMADDRTVTESAAESNRTNIAADREPSVTLS